MKRIRCDKGLIDFVTESLLILFWEGIGELFDVRVDVGLSAGFPWWVRIGIVKNSVYIVRVFFHEVGSGGVLNISDFV